MYLGMRIKRGLYQQPTLYAVYSSLIYERNLGPTIEFRMLIVLYNFQYLSRFTFFRDIFYTSLTVRMQFYFYAAVASQARQASGRRYMCTVSL